MQRVFLLSPASTRGRRGEILFRPEAQFELACRLRDGTAAVGEIFAFISGLYFRGKVAYVEAFGDTTGGIPRAVVIMAGAGLVPLDMVISIDQLRAISQIEIHERNESFRGPLLRDAKLLDQAAGPKCHYILLGSVATEKYTGPLIEVFGERLLFPEAFVGRGDMSRGGLMLRCAHTKSELSYVPVATAVRHGARPPRLEKWPKP